MSASLQKATQFFFDHFGHFVADGVSDLPPSVEARAEVTCSFCGRQGVGVWDGRSNHIAYPHKCLPCWSLYQPARGYFAGGGKDMSFSGKVQTVWIVDDRGATVYVAPQTFEQKAPDSRVTPGLRYATNANPVRDILNGDIKPPFLWGLFPKKKEQGIEILELTESLSRIIFCDGKNGTRLSYDLERLQTAFLSLMPLSADQKKDPGLWQWRHGYDILGTKKRMDAKKDLRRLGINPDLLRLSLGERAMVWAMTQSAD